MGRQDEMLEIISRLGRCLDKRSLQMYWKTETKDEIQRCCGMRENNQELFFKLKAMLGGACMRRIT